jgi:hypothetical protein
VLTAQQSPKNDRKSTTVRKENENSLVRVGKKMLSVSCETAKLRRKRVFFARFRRDLRRVELPVLPVEIVALAQAHHPRIAKRA